MPRVKTKRSKAPDGFEKVSERLDEFQEEMRAATNTGVSGAGTRAVNESMWKVFEINYKRTRFVVDMLESGEISRELYDYLCREKHCDAALAAKWKRDGYTNLCCLKCIATQDTNFGTVCICRVMRKDRVDQAPTKCATCGCTGCYH